MKRLGIFVFYDKEGILDDYVIYLLNSLDIYLNHLVIICKGKVTEKSEKRLRAFSEYIHMSENVEYDAVAYKLALTDYLGWDEVLRYDEVLLFNDSFFGPFYPLSEMFHAMEVKKCDFWGVTYSAQSYERSHGSYCFLPAHIHTYFLVFRRKVLGSSTFQDYWDKLDLAEDAISDNLHHERFLTKHLEDAGFGWATYIDASGYNSQEIGSNFNQTYYIANELIQGFRCPFMKKENFVMKDMSMQAGNTGEDIANTLAYIRDNTDYDINMIWNNILRICNIAEIKNALHLDYILPWKTAETKIKDYTYCNTAVIAHLYYDEMFLPCMEYLKQVPDKIDIYITTSNELLAEKAEKDFGITGRNNSYVLLMPNKGRDVAALLIGCKKILFDYQYVCFVHDKKTKSSIGPATIGKSFFYNMWENTLKSNAYIDNVLGLFEQDCRLGFLTPPPPIHANFFGSIGLEWHDDYQNAVDLAERLGIETNLSPDIQCFALGNVFWCRTDAIMPLVEYEFNYEEFSEEPMPTDGTISHAIERIYPYVAQAQGYYSGIVMNTDYASLQHTNLYFYLSHALSKLRTENLITDYSSLFQTDILAYCKERQNILIYGAGTYGIKVLNILKGNNIDAKGFIVSDDQPKQSEINGCRVFKLSDIPYKTDDVGIIISVIYVKDRREILDNIMQKGYKDYYLI